MILPIVAYGHPALRDPNEEIDADYPKLAELVDNMFETMYNANGVGLAAPQVARSIRLFLVDASPLAEDYPEQGLADFKRVFINPQKIEEGGAEWSYEEGCLSIPDIREQVRRKDEITLRYCGLDFEPRTEHFSGIKARIIQHEYDHLEGKLFIDYISQLRRKIIRPRLNKIARGNWNPDYPMKYSVRK